MQIKFISLERGLVGKLIAFQQQNENTHKKVHLFFSMVHKMERINLWNIHPIPPTLLTTRFISFTVTFDAPPYSSPKATYNNNNYNYKANKIYIKTST